MQGKQTKLLKQIDSRYLVTEDGEVISLLGSRGIRKNPKTLKQSTDKKGYARVTVYMDGGKKYATRVHRLVASAFLDLDLFDKNQSVHHKDRNRQNNHYTNLEVKTLNNHFSEHAKENRNKDKNYFTEEEKEMLSKIKKNQVDDFFKALGIIVED